MFSWLKSVSFKGGLMRFIKIILLITCFWVNSILAQDEFITGQVLFTAKHETMVSAELSSKVITITRDFGESFTVGDLILELDSTVARAGYIQTKAEYESAQQELKYLESLFENKTVQNKSAAVSLAAAENLKTLTSLHKTGSVTDIDLANAKRDSAVANADLQMVVTGIDKELSAAKLAVASAMSNLAMAKKNYEACFIKAPFAGKVEKLFVKKHEQVQTTQELVKLVGDQLIIGRYLLNEKVYPNVSKGNSVTVKVPILNKSFSGTISHIDPVIDPASRTFEVRIEVDNTQSEIRPGMMGQIVNMK